ncbi:uncharacterized protein LOC144454997 [Phascolarctos cinereus]
MGAKAVLEIMPPGPRAAPLRLAGDCTLMRRTGRGYPGSRFQSLPERQILASAISGITTFLENKSDKNKTPVDGFCLSVSPVTYWKQRRDEERCRAMVESV